MSISLDLPGARRVHDRLVFFDGYVLFYAPIYTTLLVSLRFLG